MMQIIASVDQEEAEMSRVFLGDFTLSPGRKVGSTIFGSCGSIHLL